MIRLSLFLLIITVSALHIQHDESTEIYNASNYYTELNSKQEKFISDIRNIKTQIDQLNQDLNSSTISKGQQLTKLQQGMADQRDSLYNIETYLNTVSDIDPCRPCNLTDDQKTLMQNKVDKVRKSLQDLQSQVDFCPDCNQIQWIKQQIKKQYNYLQFIESALQSGCLKTPYKFTEEKPIGLVNIANSLYKDNLKAPNWIYGNLTEPQYKMYMFNRTSQYNLTSCPIDYPYVNYVDNNCMSCDGIFSLDTRKCQPCPQGQHYNLTLKKCTSNSIVCQPGTKLNPKTFTCDPILCAEGLKLDINSSLCVSICTPSQVYNSTTKLCQEKIVPCKQGQHYNYTTQLCQVCPQGKFYNLTTKLCEEKSIVCKQGQFYNATTKNCENIVCSPGLFYNITSKKCEQIVCPSGQKFDLDLKKCIPKTTYSLCPPDKPYWNTTGTRCQQCPSTSPAFNADLDRCQACPTGTEWNQTSKVCEIHCPSGLILNLVSRKCECPQGKILNNLTNTCTIACPTGQKLNPTTNICQIVCPTGQILNPTTKLCENQCPTGQTLNPQTKACETQCPPGQTLNPTTRSCETQCPTGQTLNPTTKLCENQCPTGQTLNPLTKACETQCPPGQFFNSSTKFCEVQCQKGQIFNNVTKICQNQSQCPAGQFYNESIKQCQMTCRPNSQWIVSNQRCECIPGYISNSTDCIFKVINCSMPKPYWNPVSKVCQNCPAERPNFSPSINECLQPCGIGSVWDNTLYKCVNIICPPETPLLNYNTNKCQKCPQNTVWSSTKKVCESTTIDVRCPAGYSYNPKEQLCQMMVCPPGYHMNQVKNQCEKCPETYAYNETIGKCYKCPDGSTYNSTNQLCSLKVVCQSNQYFSQKQKQCKPILTCSFNQYFSIQTQSCVSYPTCQVDQILNKNTGKCQPVPKCPSGSYYNQTSTQCDKIDYVTSPNASNLIYAYNISEYAKQYQNKKLSDPLMKDCPSNTPYFDQNSKYCVACPSSNPYFNLHTNLCQNCGQLGYDEKITRCKTNDATVDPTLQRLIMNIL